MARRQNSVAVPLLAAGGVIVIVIVVIVLATRPASRSPADEQLYQLLIQHDGTAGLQATQSFSIREGERYSALWTPASCVGGKSIAATNRKSPDDRLALDHEQTNAFGNGEAMLPPLPTGTYYMTIDGRCSYTFRISRLVDK